MITLANLHRATEQQIFDQVVAHLMAQQKQARTENTGCLYRTEDGLKCAAGCLIGDDEYTTKLEGVGWHALANKGIVPTAHSSFIRELQIVHDDCPVNTWEEGLRRIAAEHDLVYMGEKQYL